MRKVLFALMAAMLMGVAFTACSDKKSSDKEKEETETTTDYIDTAKDIVADITKNGNDWDADEWEDAMEDAIKNEIAFYKSKPSKETIANYEKIQMEDALGDLNDDAKMKALAAALKVVDKYKEELDEAMEAAKETTEDDK